MVVENRTCIVCPRNWTPFMTSAFVACAVCANWMSALEWSLLLTVRRNNERHMIFTRSTSPKHEKMLNSWLGNRLQACC